MTHLSVQESTRTGIPWRLTVMFAKHFYTKTTRKILVTPVVRAKTINRTENDGLGTDGILPGSFSGFSVRILESICTHQCNKKA